MVSDLSDPRTVLFNSSDGKQGPLGRDHPVRGEGNSHCAPAGAGREDSSAAVAATVFMVLFFFFFVS